MSEFSVKFLEQNSVNTNIESLWSEFKDKIISSISKFIPTRNVRPKDTPWINRELIRLIRKQKKLFTAQRSSAYESRASKHYRAFKGVVQRKIRQAHWKYVSDIILPEITCENDRNSDPPSKRFWQYIKHCKQDKQGIAPLKHEGLLTNDPKAKANILNKQFQSVFSQSAPPPLKLLCHQTLNKNSFNDMLPFNITCEGVLKLLKGLKPHKAAGPDNLKPLVLKEIAAEITPSLTLIFQASLHQGKLPSDWKNANVTPVYKKGERYKASNYRPISLTCVCCKLLEHIIAKQILNHLDSNDILYKYQHGFRAKLSCETQLVEFSSDLVKAVQDGKQCDLVVMDFSKAFDKVCHTRLLLKLQNYKLNAQVCNWVASFLSCRSQSVIVEGESSDTIPVTSGVPQGSVLGPILFLIYINDLPDYTRHSQVRLFADDTIVYITFENSKPGCHLLQEDLRGLEKWEQDWSMSFHPEKCNVIRFSKKREKINHNYTLHGQTLLAVDSTKYLGLHFSDDLTWNTHIGKICAKANKTLGFLKRNLKIDSISVKSTAYKSMVRPLLEYSSTVWHPHQASLTSKLEGVQNRAARWVKRQYDREASVSKMKQDLNWPLLETRRQQSRIVLLYKIVNGLVLCPKTYFTVKLSYFIRKFSKSHRMNNHFKVR